MSREVQRAVAAGLKEMYEAEAQGSERDLLIRIDENVKSLVKRGDDHEHRLRKVEKKQWYHTGGIAIVGFIAAKLGLPWPSLG